MSGLSAVPAWSARVTSAEAPTLAERRPWDDPFPGRALTASSDSPVRSTISVTCSIAARPSNQPAKISHLQRENSQDHDHCWLNSPVDGRELLEVAAEYQRGALAEMSAAGAITTLCCRWAPSSPLRHVTFGEDVETLALEMQYHETVAVQTEPLFWMPCVEMSTFLN